MDGEASVELLKELTEANGTSGYEYHIRNIMHRELQKTSDEVVYDHNGSIFGKKEGESAGPRIMLAGHLDEVGFMIKSITANGYLRFTPLGGWWDQVLLSQRVQIMTEQQNFTGVIGSKPPHLMKPEDKKQVFPMDEMYIDIGANSREEVGRWGIHVGDPIVPICPYEMMPDNDTILAKALDDRVGCYLSLEVMRQLRMDQHPNVVYGGADVQEEVGLRGAQTAPYVVEPDIAFALDVGIAEDGPKDEGKENPKLGGGPLITFLDASMIPNTRFRNLVTDTADQNRIPYQIEVMTGGGTDAGKLHLFKQGVPTIAIGVAARYIHSHVSMVSKKDVENTAKLLVEVVKKMDTTACDSIVNYR